MCVMFRHSQNFNWIHFWCHGLLCMVSAIFSRILTASSTKSLFFFLPSPFKSVYHENFMIKLQHGGHTAAAHRVQWHIHETFCFLSLSTLPYYFRCHVLLYMPRNILLCCPLVASMNVNVRWLAWEPYYKGLWELSFYCLLALKINITWQI